MKQAAFGDHVQVHYRGTLDDGVEFDSSAGREPLAFTLGSGEVIAGFDQALLGMRVGESKTVIIAAEDAYGDANPALVHEVPRSEIPGSIPLAIGSVLGATDGNGQEMRLTVIAATAETVTLDANHPLAGKALTFELTLESIAA
jgi:peptidylprolyl isomerase